MEFTTYKFGSHSFHYLCYGPCYLGDTANFGLTISCRSIAYFLELVETIGLPPLPILPESIQDTLPVLVKLTISVDLSGILPEGLRDPRTRTMVVNLEQIYILTITSATQLETLKVDFVKKAIQVLCWECFQIGILKRNFKMWLQTSPYNTPGFP